MRLSSAANFFSAFLLPFNKVFIPTVLTTALALGTPFSARADGEEVAIQGEPVEPSARDLEQTEQAQASEEALEAFMNTVIQNLGEQEIPDELNQEIEAEMGEDPAPADEEPADSEPEPPVEGTQDPAQSVAQQPPQPRLTLRQIAERAVIRRLIRKYITEGIQDATSAIINGVNDGITEFFDWLNGLTGEDGSE